jgi:two-component system response regulator
MNQTILLVEDNPDDEELTLLAFEQIELAVTIVVARDGVEALNYCLGSPANPQDHQHPLPDLILLDLKLPKLDGLEVLRQLRANPLTQFVPVVVMTTSLEEQDLINSYESGCNSYVRKPVDFNQFQETAQQLGWYWLRLNQCPSPLTT